MFRTRRGVPGRRHSPSPRSSSGRYARACRPFAFLASISIILLAPSPAPLWAAQDDGHSLQALREMAAAGAPGLALQRMQEAQPEAADRPEAWAEWERARIAILIDAGAWQRALDSLTDLPGATPEPFRRWALERRADLHLELNQPDAARALLRELLWHAGPGASALELRRWRRLVVRSHLVAGDLDDAVTALRRYDQDYADRSTADLVLQTRILLRAGRADEANARLPAAATAELHALRLLAQLRRGAVDPWAVWLRARDATAVDSVDAAAAARFWFVAAEAAAEQSDPGGRALAVERAAARVASLPAAETLFRVGGSALWRAWLELGRSYANEQRLLIGDDAAWFEAVQASLPRYPVRARSLLAVVALRGGTTVRETAHARLLDSLAEHGPGLAVARQAYLHSDRFPVLGQVPPIVRYRLVDDALARDDLELATRLLEDLRAAPGNADAYNWRLLRARVLILGGRPRDGAEALASVLSDYDQLGGGRLDRLMQVVFDLQGARAHESALALLERLGERDLPGQRRRELLYWRAESHQALDAHARAAELYLRSATLLDGKGGDPWGQTARYQAAGALAEAGLISDARRIYEHLLRVTTDSKRRATLRQRLERLGLREAAPADLPAAAEGS